VRSTATTNATFSGVTCDTSPANAISLVKSGAGTQTLKVVNSDHGNTTVTGAKLTLSWPANHTGWRLEVQTNSLATGLGMDWFTVTGSAATNQMALPIDALNGSVFFRLVYP
jgi:autotransporter-associated beta strand protein